MTPEEALNRIGESAAEAVAGALEAYCPGAVIRHPPVVLDDEADPVAGVALPAVMADVSYIDGVTGGNLFLMPLPAARALAAAMMGTAPPEAEAEAEGDADADADAEGEGDPGAEGDADADVEAGQDSELTELELSAAGEVANQMMSAAAAAASAVLGQEVKIAAPETRLIATAAEALARKDSATAVVSVSIELLGHSCRLVQLVPHAFVVRMTRALDDLESELTATVPAGALPADLLGGVAVRVAAELGRVSMTIRRAVALAPGAVVELDRELEDPIDLYVNGRRFATGQLVTLDDDEWAVRIDTVEFEPDPRKGD
jgi:flagellar motor switch protein FliN/FliY